MIEDHQKDDEMCSKPSKIQKSFMKSYTLKSNKMILPCCVKQEGTNLVFEEVSD